jgi:hypothetical protein
MRPPTLMTRVTETAKQAACSTIADAHQACSGMRSNAFAFDRWCDSGVLRRSTCKRPRVSVHAAASKVIRRRCDVASHSRLHGGVSNTVSMPWLVHTCWLARGARVRPPTFGIGVERAGAVALSYTEYIRSCEAVLRECDPSVIQVKYTSGAARSAGLSSSAAPCEDGERVCSITGEPTGLHRGKRQTSYASNYDQFGVCVQSCFRTQVPMLIYQVYLFLTLLTFCFSLSSLTSLFKAPGFLRG